MGVCHTTTKICISDLLYILNDNVNANICLQEISFTKQDLANLNTLHPGFHGTGVATIDNRDELDNVCRSITHSCIWRLKS